MNILLKPSFLPLSRSSGKPLVAQDAKSLRRPTSQLRITADATLQVPLPHRRNTYGLMRSVSEKPEKRFFPD
ncbi:MAG TPA: hypothetical protein DE060_13920 [Lentisphaeria bacterium]|nr:hypothetical protein [Lentisphaeria bacterium]HCG50289.1 hypothetical protein [Lentisphaeria bacterium]